MEYIYSTSLTSYNSDVILNFMKYFTLTYHITAVWQSAMIFRLFYEVVIGLMAGILVPVYCPPKMRIHTQTIYHGRIYIRP